jgi:hypothetical protein
MPLFFSPPFRVADECGPDDRLRYQFEVISRMPMNEQKLVRGLLDAVIVKN